MTCVSILLNPANTTWLNVKKHTSKGIFTSKHVGIIPLLSPSCQVGESSCLYASSFHRLFISPIITLISVTIILSGLDLEQIQSERLKPLSLRPTRWKSVVSCSQTSLFDPSPWGWSHRSLRLSDSPWGGYDIQLLFRCTFISLNRM